MRWLYRINAAAPLQYKGELNAVWTIVAPNGDGESLTWGVPLSANGEEPATHLGISTAATEEMYLLLTEVLVEQLTNVFMNIQPYTENDWSSFLASNNLSVVRVGETP